MTCTLTIEWKEENRKGADESRLHLKNFKFWPFSKEFIQSFSDASEICCHRWRINKRRTLIWQTFLLCGRELETGIFHRWSFNECDLAGRVNAPAGSSPHFVVAKARTLPWPSLAAFYWERSSCITGLTGALCRSLLAFLTPFVFLLLHRLVTCRPFSVKLSPSGTGCLLLSSLLRLSLPFDQQFDATLSLICSPMVSLSYFLSFLS